jgi:7 transmembrane sweet-taste receptor of 3 GCPR
MIVIGSFEIFVLYKACRTSPSRRHLFLGQMLLLALFLSSALGIAFAPAPTWWSCTIIRAGLGICFCLIIGTLLVKTVFLISLHSGTYLPAEYQALLLFFIVLTQVAIAGQWLFNHSSNVIIDHVDGYG